MTKNTAGDAREPSVWSGRSIVAGAAALFVGTALAAEVAGFAQLAAETPAPPDGFGGMLLVLPFLSCFGVPFALLASLLVVLPVVWAARRVGDRAAGRDAWWWVPAVAVLPAVLVTAAAGLAPRPGPGDLALVWLTAQSLLTGAALCARDAALHGGRLLRVLGYGGPAATAVFGVGALAYGTGLVTEYSPPKATAAQLAGTWRDGHGGTLWLSADGTARAERLTDHDAAYEDHEDHADTGSDRYRCTGTGRWTYEPGDSNTWDQRLELTVGECAFNADAWSIGGTPGHLKLLQEYGDIDDPHWYTLTR
ncbi:MULTISPECIES: hypothetical protein [unclassified Streptomyces]|uniref:hypothetical protein n=1 Tax=unclassified Streptomyces TaxID=2593676 RepID=UPI000DABF7D1|nr:MULTISPECIES: hypothetical protein [unclassified Streptomyces]PZT75880.1 hypothetical protein DNK56_20955 [Streptomyces sp. AC1-42W]PZT80168.1 hypothetical protein DNK55_11730 [Streptomyces sp. AC1-42T]